MMASQEKRRNMTLTLSRCGWHPGGWEETLGIIWRYPHKVQEQSHADLLRPRRGSPTVEDLRGHHRSSPLNWCGRFIQRSEIILGIPIAFRDQNRDTFRSRRGRCRRCIELLPYYGHAWQRD